MLAALIVSILFISIHVHAREDQRVIYQSNRPSSSDGPYHLFNRAPRETLRRLAPETHPYTTEPGWIQLEMTPFNYIYYRDNSTRTRIYRSWVLLKVGIWDNVDFQVGMTPLHWERVGGHKQRGYGDVLLASKINLMGNDGGENAVALKYYITLPTARKDLGTDKVEGGILVPFYRQIDDNLGIDFIPVFGAARNPDKEKYFFEYGQRTALSYDLEWDILAFMDIESIFNTESFREWVGLFGFGVRWDFSESTVFELRPRLGISSAAPDFNGSVSLVQRF